MELRYLESFVTLADELHFGRAAERLYISQPALSKQIRILEEDVGVMLLERTQRHVALTSAGKAFLDHARHILKDIGESKAAAVRAAQGQTGELILSFTDSALYSFLPSIIKRFRAAYPQVNLRLQERYPAQQIDELQARTSDLAMTYPPVSTALCSRIVHEETVIAVLPDDHRLAEADLITLSDLDGEPFISHPPALAPALHAQVTRHMESLGFYPHVVQEAASKQTIISLVAAGIGVALIPSSLQGLRRDGVVYRPLREQFTFTTLAVWHPENANHTLTNFLAMF